VVGPIVYLLGIRYSPRRRESGVIEVEFPAFIVKYQYANGTALTFLLLQVDYFLAMGSFCLISKTVALKEVAGPY
jgi:hypothetical protein